MIEITPGQMNKALRKAHIERSLAVHAAMKRISTAFNAVFAK